MAVFLFEVADKDGTTVRLREDRWDLHIVEKHSEVEPYLEEIKKVIRSPAIITQDAGGSHHLSRLGAVEQGWKDKYLEIIVKYSGELGSRTGRVLTVFFNERPPKGDMKWMTRS